MSKQKIKGLNIKINSQSLVTDEYRKLTQSIITLKHMKTIKGTPEHEFRKKQLETLKTKAKSTLPSGYEIIITTKAQDKLNKRKKLSKDFTFGNYYFLDTYPSKNAETGEHDLKEMLNDFIVDIKDSRLNRKNISEENKNYLGIKYKTVAGVFTKPNSIKDIMSTIDNNARINETKKPNEKIKRNYIGVEYEFISNCTSDLVKKELIKAGLAGYVNVKSDGSIQTEKEGQHPIEITALIPQEYYREIIAKVCKVLRDKPINGYVNNSCGLHVHLDMRNRNPHESYSRLVKSLNFLYKLVPETRTTSSQGLRYCKKNQHENLSRWYNENHEFVGDSDDRYWAVNPIAFKKFKTLEVRLHGGSLNTKKISNWVEILLSLIDTNFVGTISDLSDYVKKVGCSDDLMSFITERMATFDKHKDGIDVRWDHFSEFHAS